MRVITGSARGTKLAAPPDCDVRPMLDRVKESLFNILGDRARSGTVLDLFSGTGGLGIEALSRGAERCIFVESGIPLAACIGDNLARTRLADKATIIRADVMSGPGAIPFGSAPVSLLLCDPPYAKVASPTERESLCKAVERWLAETGLSPEFVGVVHHGPPSTIMWAFDRLALFDSRLYGKSVLSFFRPNEQG